MLEVLILHLYKQENNPILIPIASNCPSKSSCQILLHGKV